MKTRRLLTLLILFFTIPCFAATYYVDGDAVDDTGVGSIGDPKKYIISGTALLAGGDTLEIADGTYTGANNCWGSWFVDFPNGTSGLENHTTIKATNDFQVTIDGEGVRTPLGLGTDSDSINYITFRGIIFADAPGSVFYIHHAEYVYVKNCGAVDAGGGNAFNFSSGTNLPSYVLFEDCFAWGQGRYKFAVSSQYSVVRRCVARYDYHPPVEWPHASFTTYTGTNTHFQNCISVDGLFTATGHYQYSFGNANGWNYGSNKGSIALNNDFFGIFIEEDGGIDVDDIVLTDIIIWDANDFGIGSNYWGDSGVVEITATNITIGNIGDGTYVSDPDSVGFTKSLNYNSILTTNSILHNGADDGFEFPNSSNNYNCLHANVNDYNTGSPGANTYCDEGGCATTIDPIDGSAHNGNGTTALEYLLRIKTGSDLDGAGSGGVDIGAEVLKRYSSSDGLFYGEGGWDTLTDTDLWPFPNEDIIKTKMKAYAAHSVDGTRGFCTTGNQLDGSTEVTLTSYIWEYLGNQIPDEIYGGEEESSPVNVRGYIGGGYVR